MIETYATVLLVGGLAGLAGGQWDVRPPGGAPLGPIQILVPILCFAISSYAQGLYSLRPETRVETIQRLLRALGIASVLLLVAYLAAPAARLTQGAVSSVLAAAPIVAGASVLIHLAARFVLTSASSAERVLIVGDGPLALKVATALDETCARTSRTIGFVIEQASPRETLQGKPVLGSLERLADILREARPDRVVVAVPERRSCLPLDALLAARVGGARVETGVTAYEKATGKVAIESLSPSELIYSDGLRPSRAYAAAQRAASAFGAALGLLVTAPLMAVIAVAVRLSSPGPVLFVQERIGLGDRPFRLYKFRTMTEASETRSEWERDNADRVTPAGYWLRKFRLDELPQFWNVLRGDMNFIGPRPQPVRNFELFGREIPYYSLRHMIRPGITGWAQVQSGYAQDLEGEIEKMRYDLHYITHMSLRKDLQILVKTVEVVLFPPATHEAATWAREDRAA